MITASGRNLATGLASPACSVSRTTSSTSLYASGASSERTFGVLALTWTPCCSSLSIKALASTLFLAAVLESCLPAPWQDEEKASLPPFEGPARTHEAVPISPGTRTGWPTDENLAASSG